MSSAGQQNGHVAENPHPEDEVDLPEGAEGQGQDEAETQDRPEADSDDSIEEGTEAELEAEDEAGSRVVGGDQERRGRMEGGGDSIEEGTEAELEAEDEAGSRVVGGDQERRGRMEGGGDSIEEGTEAELEAEDEAGSHKVVRVEGSERERRGRVEGGEEADTDSETEDFVMPTAEGAAIREGQVENKYEAGGGNSDETEHDQDIPTQQSQLVCDLAEADVGVMDRDMATESDRHFGDVNNGDSGQVDDHAADVVQVGESVEADTELVSVPSDCQPEGSAGLTSVLDIRLGESEHDLGCEDQVEDIMEEGSAGLLEDELCCVQDKRILSVTNKLQRGESGESWEPECDQDSEDARAALYDTQVQSDSCGGQGPSSDSCEDSVSLDPSDVCVGQKMPDVCVNEGPSGACVSQGLSDACVNQGPSDTCVSESTNMSEDRPAQHVSVSPEACIPDLQVESLDQISSQQELDTDSNISTGSDSKLASGVCTTKQRSGDGAFKNISPNKESNSVCTVSDIGDVSQVCVSESDNHCQVSDRGASDKGNNSESISEKGSNSDSDKGSNYKCDGKIKSKSENDCVHEPENCDMVKQGLLSSAETVDDDLLDELESELTNPSERSYLGINDLETTVVECGSGELTPTDRSSPMLADGGELTPTDRCSPVASNRVEITATDRGSRLSPNGFVEVGIHTKLVQKLQTLQQMLKRSKVQTRRQQDETSRWKSHSEDCEDQMGTAIKERDAYLRELKSVKERNVDDLYIPQIKELEFTIAQQQNEVRRMKEKLSSHDSAAKKCIAGLQTEMKHRVDQVTKMYEEANRDKADMVVKYAQAEKNFMGAHKAAERLEVKVREIARERDGLNNNIKDAKVERKRLQKEIDIKISDVQGLTKDLEKEREMLVSADVRIKWSQNKLKAELESHKDTKLLQEKTNQKLSEAKEETEQIRRNCQEIVKTYQESEEIKSNNLDNKLKMKESELLQHQQLSSGQEEAFAAVRQEREQLRGRQKELVMELGMVQEKCERLESELRQYEETTNKYTAMLQRQKKDNKDLQTRIEQLAPLQNDLKRAQTTIKSLDAEIAELKISNKDLKIESEACYKREAEKLELTEKLSRKNAEVQSENTVLQNKSLNMSSDIQSFNMEVENLESKVKELSHDLEQERRLRQREVTHLTASLEEKTKAVDELTRQIDDEKDEIKTLKRKHTNNVKDLTRQLHQAKKRLETVETNGERETTSMGSRTSSNGSLNTMADAHNGPTPTSVQGLPSVRHHSPQEQEYPVITEQVEPDRQLLIERIVKLQRSHARKNEKIEFMDDHISQLIYEIHKKTKIIQSYALREESGTMTPEIMDHHKARLSKKHSIMGSLYSSHQTDGSMTLDLSLQINRKLQAVLEDTLLKNITLKESLDTLGGEISRLSQENRQLQLSTQAKQKPAR